jgi:hypothetical protein
MRTSFRLAASLAAAVAAAPTAGAQSWTTFTPANGTAGYTNSSGYWNNRSDDNAASGAVCNVGSLLTTATSACGSQKPDNWLPLNVLSPADARVLQGPTGNAVAFSFAAGTWQFDLLGRVAGADAPSQTAWGVRDLVTGIETRITDVSYTLAAPNAFALFIDSWNPGEGAQRRFYSDMTVGGLQSLVQQHVVFTDAANAAGAGTSTLAASGVYYVGMEDNACDAAAGAPCAVAGLENTRGRFSDRDYNDFAIRMSAVPEPSTYALMATGLAGVLGAARRRRATQA